MVLNLELDIGKLKRKINVDNDIDGPSRIPFGLRMAKMAMTKSNCKIKVGASLVSKGRIILGYNQQKSSPRAVQWYKYIDQSHAEFNLFARMIPPVKGIVSIFRQFANGQMALARPCPYCINMLKFYGIKTIRYTTSNDSWTEERL